jgi:hypothetical protein
MEDMGLPKVTSGTGGEATAPPEKPIRAKAFRLWLMARQSQSLVSDATKALEKSERLKLTGNTPEKQLGVSKQIAESIVNLYQRKQELQEAQAKLGSRAGFGAVTGKNDARKLERVTTELMQVDRLIQQQMVNLKALETTRRGKQEQGIDLILGVVDAQEGAAFEKHGEDEARVAKYAKTEKDLRDLFAQAKAYESVTVSPISQAPQVMQAQSQRTAATAKGALGLPKTDLEQVKDQITELQKTPTDDLSISKKAKHTSQLAALRAKQEALSARTTAPTLDRDQARMALNEGTESRTDPGHIGAYFHDRAMQLQGLQSKLSPEDYQDMSAELVEHAAKQLQRNEFQADAHNRLLVVSGMPGLTDDAETWTDPEFVRSLLSISLAEMRLQSLTDSKATKMDDHIRVFERMWSAIPLTLQGRLSQDPKFAAMLEEYNKDFGQRAMQLAIEDHQSAQKTWAESYEPVKSEPGTYTQWTTIYQNANNVDLAAKRAVAIARRIGQPMPVMTKTEEYSAFTTQFKGGTIVDAANGDRGVYDRLHRKGLSLMPQDQGNFFYARFQFAWNVGTEQQRDRAKVYLGSGRNI